ncbi:helix-turn-helix domain-containing protein [Ferrovibrio xuzhouensis]|uniref:Helix-turn-helix domain-containing protein n=1 Tax=Ferrovibrio xuzhouensis TaxID=1576914 RepID=A0ABV7VB36_9PROT
MHLLEAYRRENKLTYQALAALIGGVNASQARKYALGLTMPPGDTIRQIAVATGFRVTANDMFGIDAAGRRLLIPAEAA